MHKGGTLSSVYSWPLRQPRNRLNYPSVMHQSFVTTVPMRPGNSGDTCIDFFLCKARVYAQHCGNNFMIKALFKSWQANVKLPRPSGHENQKHHARGSTALGTMLRSNHGT